MKTLRYEAGNVQRLHRKTMCRHHGVWVILARLQCSKRQSAALLGPEYLALRDASALRRLGYYNTSPLLPYRTPAKYLRMKTPIILNRNIFSQHTML